MSQRPKRKSLKPVDWVLIGIVGMLFVCVAIAPMVLRWGFNLLLGAGG